MRKYILGLCAGAAGAVVNDLFLLMAPDISPNIYLSTAATWLVIGLLVSACDFPVHSILKGIFVALLVALPSLIYTVSSSASGAAWTLANTVIWGAVLGFAVDKMIHKVPHQNNG
jgi:hypothetical protein